MVGTTWQLQSLAHGRRQVTRHKGLLAEDLREDLLVSNLLRRPSLRSGEVSRAST